MSDDIHDPTARSVRATGDDHAFECRDVIDRRTLPSVSTDRSWYSTSTRRRPPGWRLNTSFRRSCISAPASMLCATLAFSDFLNECFDLNFSSSRAAAMSSSSSSSGSVENDAPSSGNANPAAGSNAPFSYSYIPSWWRNGGGMSEPGVAPNEPVKFTYRVTGDLWREQPAERTRHKLSHQLIVLVGGFHVLCLPPIALRRWVHFEFFF